VDVEGPPAAQCSVWPDGVEELPVALGFESELVAVVDRVRGRTPSSSVAVRARQGYASPHSPTTIGSSRRARAR